MAKNAKKKSKKNKQQQLYNTLQLSIGFGINVIILILLVQAFYFAYHFSYDVFSDTAYNINDSADIAVTIDSGASSMEVATLLEEKGVVENKYVAFVRAKLTKATVIPGTYVLKPSMTLDEIYEVLSNTEQEEES
ncbi:MAG: endolytic transglycosylase MltG [Lachnospiraceae bacterium]|nr:endolytic transglycosylase MltG [Lachnospiraceae bacterium]